MALIRPSSGMMSPARPFGSGASGAADSSGAADGFEFLVARGLVEATTPTDADGYFYVPPLEGTVHGQLTLLATGAGSGSSDVLRLPLPQECALERQATPIVADGESALSSLP